MNSQSGVSSVEYAMVAALLALIVVPMMLMQVAADKVLEVQQDCLANMAKRPCSVVPRED